MSTLHPTTAALLLAARNAKDITTRLSEPPLYGPEVDDAVTAWKAAGCPDAPEPRFVPTKAGWYWRRVAHPGPCPPKPRTAEEARKEPMPGDRWMTEGNHLRYTLLRHNPDLPGHWFVVWSNGDPGAGHVSPGLPAEDYLGNFPLETP